VLNPTTTHGCVSTRIFLNSTFVPRRTCLSLFLRRQPGTPPNTKTKHRHGNSDSNRKGKRTDDEEIPSVLRSYRYDINNNNPAETFERITNEVAQYVATEVHGAGYMRRALINLEEPTILPPPKPKEPDSEIGEEEYENKYAEYEANCEVWKEEVKLVARRRMEQKTNILPSVYAVVWRQCTSDMKELIRSTNEFQAIDESNNVIALLKLIRASTVVDQRSQHPALCSLQALTKFTSFRQMSLRNDVYLEGFRDRVNLYEEITGDMIGSDSKSIEAEFGGSTR
jgi:hypothetical protein